MWTNIVKKQDFQSLMRDAKDFALLNGLVLRYRNLPNDNTVAHIPFTLFPSTFPEHLYDRCCEAQPIISKLMFGIANDHEYICNSLGDIVKTDDFTRNLLDIDKKVQKEGQSQSVISCINRSDYLLDSSSHNNKVYIDVKQVEVNAIASSMSAHSVNVKQMHEFLLSKYNMKTTSSYKWPSNESLDLVAQGLIDAFMAYNKQESYVLMVVEESSPNFSDQFLIELKVHQLRPDVRIIRKEFSNLPDFIKLGPNKELICDGDKEVALVYFRYGYDPSNYSFNGAWETRLTLERSRAIKCPSVNFHLSGAKKFQQILNNQKQLEKFLEPIEAQKLTKLFCAIYPIDPESPEGQTGFKIGMKSKNHVLKPQREGGGHNVFREDIRPFLEQLSEEERYQYILMAIINSPSEDNWLLLQNETAHYDKSRFDHPDQLISELGIYGSILGEKNVGISSNKFAGYLMRSKKTGVNEGGVSSGFAGISSLMLKQEDY